MDQVIIQARLMVLLGALGCAGNASTPAASVHEPSSSEPPSCDAGEAQTWVHMPMLVGADPSRPLDELNTAVLDEMVSHLRARADIALVRVEAHGCHGEAPERTLARAALVRDELIERGLPPRTLTTAGYPPPSRGCYCPCEVFDDPPPEVAGPGAKKNCAIGAEGCRRIRDQVLRVEFSLLVCGTPWPAARTTL